MTNSLIGFLVFWGIWLFVPLLIDGTTAIAYFVGAWRYERTIRRRRQSFVLTEFPAVAIIVPVYNGEDYLGKCLDSIRRQTYPHEQMHVIVVDNMSTDRTREVFLEEQSKPFAGRMELVSLPFTGKAWAINAGIHKASAAEFICNLDSDTILKEDAIYGMVRAFVHDESLAAATGTIEVLDVDSRDMHPLRYAMSQAEFIEYYVAFRIGREYQTITNSLFTLAGAFSFFRRSVLLQTSLYNNMTVSEDTSLTFEVHRNFPDMRIVAVAEAVACVEPSPGLGALYSQRVRWQRGELEVLSLYPEFIRSPLRLKGVSSIRALLIDHTLAFPRMVWTFLLPLMYFLGYPLRLVASAVVAMYLAYTIIDGLYMLVAYALSEQESRRRLRRVWWVFAVLPVFRYITFWFRFGGFLVVLMEPPAWRVRDPWVQTVQALMQLRSAVLYAITHLPFRIILAALHLLRGS